MVKKIDSMKIDEGIGIIGDMIKTYTEFSLGSLHIDKNNGLPPMLEKQILYLWLDKSDKGEPYILNPKNSNYIGFKGSYGDIHDLKDPFRENLLSLEDSLSGLQKSFISGEGFYDHLDKVNKGFSSLGDKISHLEKSKEKGLYEFQNNKYQNLKIKLNPLLISLKD